jgi:hypothetical protein
MEPMRKQRLWIYGGISAIMLLCMLAYPAGYDQSVFSAGGRMIVEQGAVPYRDFLDTKPPIIFYIYATAHALFGDGIIAVRLLDVLLQGLSLYVLFRVLQRVFAEQDVAIKAVLIYTVLYVSSGYWMTAQSESYALIPSLLVFSGVISFETEELTKGKLLRLGLLLALSITVLFFLKYTLASIAFGVVGHLLFTSKVPLAKRISLLAYFGGGVLLLFALAILVFEVTGIYEAALQAINWVSGYGNITPLLDKSTIRQQYFLDFPSNLLLTLSPTFFILSVIGFYTFHSSRGLPPLRDRIGVETLRAILYWFLATGLLGVLLERKAMTYHYSRVFWVVAVTITVAWISIAKRYKEAGENKPLKKSWRTYSALILAGIPIVFFSPLTRIISHPLQWSWLALTNDMRAQHERLKFDNYYGHERSILKEYFADKLAAGENIFLWGHFVELYSILARTPTTICLTNTPLVTEWTPLDWKRQLIAQLEAQRPKYILIERNDVHSFINGRSVDSHAMMLEWADFKNFLERHYRNDTTIGSFSVYAHL